MPDVFNVYNSHKRNNTLLPPMNSVEEVRGLAEAAARLGHDAFYRVFRVTSDSVSGERFETAFSVLGGVVREHQDVTFPAAHW